VRVLALEGQLADGELVQHDAAREHVGAEVELLAEHVLGRHVRRRAEQLPGHGHALRVDHLRDAEVGQLDHPVGPDHHVLRLDVAVQDAVAVGVGQRAADLRHHHRAELGEARRVIGDELLERRALDELGDDVALGRVAPEYAKISRMFSWRSLATAWASRSKRSRASAWSARCRCSTFTATSRLSERSSPR
jgi:hypothetical protein